MKQAALCAVWHELSLLPSALQQLAAPCYKIVPLHLLLHLHLQPQQAADEVENLIPVLLSQTKPLQIHHWLEANQPSRLVLIKHQPVLACCVCGNTCGGLVEPAWLVDVPCTPHHATLQRALLQGRRGGHSRLPGMPDGKPLKVHHLTSHLGRGSGLRQHDRQQHQQMVGTCQLHLLLVQMAALGRRPLQCSAQLDKHTLLWKYSHIRSKQVCMLEHVLSAVKKDPAYVHSNDWSPVTSATFGTWGTPVAVQQCWLR